MHDHMNIKFLDRFLKNTQISNFVEIHVVEPSCSMRTDRQTDVQT